MTLHYVVLDTNVLIDTHGLNTSALAVLRDLAPPLRVRLAVPQAVVEEYEAHARRKLESLVTEQAALNKELRRWGEPPGGQPTIDLEALLSRLMTATRARFVEYGVEIGAYRGIVPLPASSSEALLRRAIGKVPPFSAGGAGLPDTLIWLTTLGLLQRPDAPRVTLVTNDGDFFVRGKGPTALLPPLLKEAGAGDRLDHQATLWGFVAGIEGLKLDAKALEGLSWVRNDQRVLTGVLDALRVSPALVGWPSLTVKQVDLQFAVRTPHELVVAVKGTATASVFAAGIGPLFAPMAQNLFGGLFDGGSSIEYAAVDFGAHVVLSPPGDASTALRSVECSHVAVQPAAAGTLAARVLAAAARIDP